MIMNMVMLEKIYQIIIIINENIRIFIIYKFIIKLTHIMVKSRVYELFCKKNPKKEEYQDF